MPLALIIKALIAIFIIAIDISTANAQPLRAIPALSARVIDETGTLGSAELQSLQNQLAAVEQRHGSQVVLFL